MERVVLARMVKKDRRIENKRKPGFGLLVGEKVGITDLVERGSWAACTHAHPASVEDQRVFDIARGLEVRPLRSGST